MKNEKPLVSIGMPTRNGEEYIRRAIDSLLAQDYENFELIISDNASTDRTLQICKEYAARDNRIIIYIHSYNVGMLANGKKVLEMARGKYFMWAGDDDYWMPEFVSTLVKELENHPEAGVAMSAADRVNEEGAFLRKTQFENDDNPNNKTYYQMMKSFTTPFKKHNLFIYGLFRTGLLKKAFMPVKFGLPGLEQMFMSTMTLATRFRYVDKVLHIRTDHYQPEEVRLPDEEHNKARKDMFLEVKMLFAQGQMIYSSDLIPWHRKLYLPLVLCHYGWTFLVHKFSHLIAKRVTPDTWTWNQFKKIRRFLSGENF